MSRSLLVVAAAMALIAPAVGEVPPASHTLYLDFGPDPDFPEFTFDANWYFTSPLEQFYAGELDPDWGLPHTASLRNAITEIVQKDYEEFDLEVTQEGPDDDGYVRVGIDHKDANLWNVARLFGQAYNPQEADPPQEGDPIARVWAGSFRTYGDGAWEDENSTIGRWSMAIGNVAAHEAGHCYGLRHEDSACTIHELVGPHPCSQTEHIMATPQEGQTPEQTATVHRHFSDTSYSKLAAALGLSSPSLCNVDFVNRNTSDAKSFYMKLYSKHQDLTPKWEYSKDPFGTPRITNQGPKWYKDEWWYEYHLEWSGVPGESGLDGPDGSAGPGIAPGEKVHFGVGLPPIGEVVLIGMALLDRDGGELPARPPAIYARDILTKPDGEFVVTLGNAADAGIILRNLRFRMVPRMIDLDGMVADRIEDPCSRLGLAVGVLDDIRVSEGVVLGPGDEEDFVLASLGDWMADRLPGFTDPAGGSAAYGAPNSPPEPPREVYWDMFPSTYVYITADVVLSGQELWDADLRQFVTEDLVTQVFFQLDGAPVLVPEPAAIWLLACGVLGVIRRRRRAHTPR